jgi:hypothetical protein
MTYSEQLKSPEWFEYRGRVIESKGSRCELCHDMHYVEDVQVHHCGYDFERKAWEYNFEEVKVLCRSCHQTIHRREKGFLRLFESVDHETLAHLLHGLLVYKEIYEEKERCHANRIYLFLRRQKQLGGFHPEIETALGDLQHSGRILESPDKEASYTSMGIIEHEEPPDLSPILPNLKLKKACRRFRNFLLGLDTHALDPLLDGFDVFLQLAPAEQRVAAYNLVRFLNKLDQLYEEGRLGGT